MTKFGEGEVVRRSSCGRAEGVPSARQPVAREAASCSLRGASVWGSVLCHYSIVALQCYNGIAR
jgi:hypothetical protein